MEEVLSGNMNLRHGKGHIVIALGFIIRVEGFQGSIQGAGKGFYILRGSLELNDPLDARRSCCLA